MTRIKGLDTIRFACALYVLFGHFGFPFLPELMKETTENSLGFVIGTLFGLCFNGPAAVIIFFIVSGFCINFPYRESKKIDLAAYYSRRYIRIILPALVAGWVCFKVGTLPPAPNFGVFWSIICELVYYTIFPLLFLIRKRINWSYIVAIAYIVSTIILFKNLDLLREFYNDYPAFGFFNWVIGLPCWLLGCWLSDNYHRFRSLSTIKMWMLRLIVVIVVLLLRIVKFQAPTVFASNCFTLNAFAVGACFWLGYEIAYYQERSPSSILEWAGTWSYSLYIIHPATAGLIAYLSYSNVSGAMTIILSLVLSYVFFLLIEKPSHRIAVLVSRRFSASKKFNT